MSAIAIKSPEPVELEYYDGAEDDGIVDEAQNDETVIAERYDISSYGADYDVEGLVKRLDRGDIWIPEFQRDYVWTMNMASRFIESLLLGLPVPGVFLARDPVTNKLIVIDGQQRLKTLQFFYDGFFNPKPNEKSRRVFRLTHVQEQFLGKTYATLDEEDRVKLNDSIIHATVIKQESPEDDDTSVYHVFERLNAGGLKLSAQEIRTAVYHGDMIDLVRELNDHEPWREMFGPRNKRLKDQELILRFLALFNNIDDYERPMAEFLNKYAGKYRVCPRELRLQSQDLFVSTIDEIKNSIGRAAFRPERTLNAAVFDAVMVGLARRLSSKNGLTREQIRAAYNSLLKDAEFEAAIVHATSDEKNVLTRINRSTFLFSKA